MKRILIILLLTLIDIECMHYSLNSCPDCTGNAHDVSAPFFTDECYQESQFTNLQTFDLGETDTSSIVD